jgi:hypothetical protein
MVACPSGLSPRTATAPSYMEMTQNRRGGDHDLAHPVEGADQPPFERGSEQTGARQPVRAHNGRISPEPRVPPTLRATWIRVLTCAFVPSGWPDLNRRPLDPQVLNGRAEVGAGIRVDRIRAGQYESQPLGPFVPVRLVRSRSRPSRRTAGRTTSQIFREAHERPAVLISGSGGLEPHSVTVNGTGEYENRGPALPPHDALTV